MLFPSPRHCLVLAAVLCCCLGAQQATALSFVYRQGSQLYADGSPFYHMGFNAVWMPSSASFSLTQRVDDVLDAAQRMGLKVVRVFGFNDAFPYLPGKYNAKQGRGLDYVIAAAGQRGIRVELPLANFWPAYMGPESWLAMAENKVGSNNLGGKNVADFYRSEKVLRLLEYHIGNMTSRVNTLTGVAYRDDPTIIGYNLFNEPRCPGCTPADMAARNAFINSLAATLTAAAPKQLTFSGTEGFFAAGDPNVGFNPGHGTQCEGEDWTKEITGFDVATTHMYWRQMESWKQTNNQRPGLDFYIQYLYRKLKLYIDVAAASGRPVVIEEFGLTRRFYGDEEMKVVVAVVADVLIAAKRAGKPLMGAWLWQAAPPGDPNVGGYDVSFTKPLSGAAVGLGNLKLVPPGSTPAKTIYAAGISEEAIKAGGTGKVVTLSQLEEINKEGGAGGAAAGGVNSQRAGSEAGARSSSNASATVATSSALPGSRPAAAAAGNSTATAAAAVPARAVTGRRMLDATGPLLVLAGEDALGAFRREAQRATCADAVVGWPEQPIPAVVDVQAYVSMVAQHNMVDILAEAARLLNA